METQFPKNHIDIVIHSKSQNSIQTERAISNKLWKIAGKKFSVVKPIDKETQKVSRKIAPSVHSYVSNNSLANSVS